MGKTGRQLFGWGPYEYFLYQARTGEQFSINHLASFSLYLLRRDHRSVVRVSGVEHSMENGDRVQVERDTIVVRCSGGNASFLIAGTTKPHPRKTGIAFTRYDDLYRVTKPWGQELWINGQHPCYALKQISIRAGTKTSLQYHNLKQETNVLFDGMAKLHFKKNPGLPNTLVSALDLTTVELSPISSIDILPRTLHRLEALTDLLLYETSTPHLDDVIRVQDDSNRSHGRIASEHRVTT